MVRFAFCDYAEGGKTSYYKTLPVLAFIGRLIRHIPDKHFEMIRYTGLFAPRSKARYRAQAHAALARENKAATKSPAQSEAAKASLLPWHQRRLAEKHEDFLVCSGCHAEMELIEVVFGSHAAIARYFEMAQRAIAPFHPAWALAPGVIMLTWFRKVTFMCTYCGAAQRIPLRRLHFFERFHELSEGRPVVVRCPQCRV